MPKTPKAPDPRDAEIRRLENALYLARHTIIELMPEPAHKLLSASIWCGSLRDIAEWEHWAVEGILAIATPLPEPDPMSGSPRANCPLCGAEAQDAYTRGFKLPVGLTRHLKGSHGSRRCGVISAAIEPCYERVREERRLGALGPRFTEPATPKPWEVESAPDSAPTIELQSAVIIRLRPEQ